MSKKDFRPRLGGSKKDWENILKRIRHLGLKNAEDVLYDRQSLTDAEIVTLNDKLAKQKQKLTDIQRIERKGYREKARIENALGEYHKALLDRLNKNPISVVKVRHKTVKDDVALVVQLSDTHFNELVDISSNKYDFKVAAKRLKLFADEIISIGKWQKAKRLVISLGGDLLNSDRRKDELLSMATNRANASLLGAELLCKMFLDLAKYFNITVCSITGNESRAGMELGWSETLASDSYDTIIYGMIRFLLHKDERFTFLSMKANEAIFEVNSMVFLSIHGHQVRGDIQKSIQTIIGKYSAKGIKVDYVLLGHIHATYIGDYHARNASLVGSNSYSEEGLNFVSKAAQNIHIVDNNGRINSVKVDLQETSDVTGYDIDDLCDCYNVKSADKLKQSTTIIQIVI